MKNMPIYREYFAYNTNFSPLAAGDGTNAVFTDNIIRIDTDSDFEIHYVIHTATSSLFRLKYTDDSVGRNLMKGHLHAMTISGTALSGITSNGFTPYYWDAPLQIAAATSLTVSAADFSMSANTIRFTMHGAKIKPGTPPWQKNWRQMIPYTYPMTSTGTVTVAANGSTTSAIQTDRDSAFQVMKITGRATGACTLTIKDSARDAQWMSDFIHFNNIVGNSQFPHKLAHPRFIPPGGVISVAINDLSGSSNTVEINFAGRKLYE